MTQLSTGSVIKLLLNADRIKVTNGDNPHIVNGWFLAPYMRVVFNKSHITPRLASKLAELQYLVSVDLLVETGDVEIKLPLLSGKYQLRVDNGRLIRWPENGLSGGNL